MATKTKNQTTEGVKEEGTFKVKKKPKVKKLNKKDEPIKIDLSKNTTEDGISESGSGNMDETQPTTPVAEVVEEVRELPTEQTEPETGQVIEEITDVVVNEEVKEVIETTKEELPENVEKLVDFMKETGGTMVDYIRLNTDYSQIDNDIILKEYYTHIKPHLNSEEIEFMMDDEFTWDEDYDDERGVRKKKLALKEEVAKAKVFFDDLKGKYYDEIKLRPGVTQEQQKAMDFFNRYNTEQETVKQRHDTFKNTTKDFFSKDFKGFEFNLGEKRFKYGVSNPTEVANNQSNLSDFVKKFLDDKGNVVDYEGYHKAIYAARNADTIAKHFYDQGKTDAIKNMTARSKNISTEPRTTPHGDVYLNGLRVKAISGVDSSKLKIKRNNN